MYSEGSGGKISEESGYLKLRFEQNSLRPVNQYPFVSLLSCCPIIKLIVANLFMDDYEGKALEAYQNPPKYWGRYVDDALAVIKTANIEPFTRHLYAHHTSIQWTSELEADGKVPMLDNLTSRMTDGSLKFSVHRKPTQYLQFQSHQPMEHTMGVTRTLTHRAHTISSDPQEKER